MLSYVLRRALTSLIVIVGISVVTYALLHLMSPSPGRTILGLEASPEAVAAFNHEHGFDRSVVIQYLSYMGDLFRGDLGHSYKLNQDVTALLAQNAGRTAMLVGVALALAVLIAVPLGILQAVKRNSWLDHLLAGITFTTYSMPAFFLALILIEVFALRLHIFPVQASQSQSAFVVFTDPMSMVLPVVTLTAITVALYSRYQRSATIDQLVADYATVARAKGLSRRQVLFRHVLRNACLPLINMVGVTFPLLLAGNVVVEQVFNYPGLGLLFFKSLQAEDYPVLLAYVLLSGILTVAGNFLADLLLSIVDPRISFA